MLSSLLAAIGAPFINRFFDAAENSLKAYFNKQISKEQLMDELLGHLLQAARDIEVSHAEALAKTYAAFVDAMKASRIIRLGWFITLMSQVFVLSWAQWAVPFLIWMFGGSYPSNGDLVQWAYLLIGFLCGGGPLILRAGPGKGTVFADARAATIKQKGECG